MPNTIKNKIDPYFIVICNKNRFYLANIVSPLNYLTSSRIKVNGYVIGTCYNI